MKKTDEKGYPNSFEAEVSTLQCLAYYPSLMGEAASKLPEGFFYNERNHSFYKVLLEEFTAGHPLDAISIGQVLEDRGLLEKMGGMSEVVGICSSSTTSEAYEYHVGILRDKFLLRQTILGCEEIIKKCHGPNEDSSIIIDVADQAARFVQNQLDLIHSSQSKAETWEDQVIKFEHVFHDALKGKKTSFYPSRWRRWNAEIGGIPKALITLSGPEKKGKTAVALNIATDLASLQDESGNDIGVPGIFFTQEMPDTDLISRIIADVAGVEGQYIFAPDRSKPTRETIMKIADASEKIRSWKFKVIHNPEITLEGMEYEINQMKKLHGKIGFIVADYLQIFGKPRGLERNATREREISELTKRFKIMQGKHDCVFLLLAQQNQDGSFRESRSVGMHTHMAVQIQEDGLKVTLNRNGPAGQTIPLTLDGPHFRFTEKFF